MGATVGTAVGATVGATVGAAVSDPMMAGAMGGAVGVLVNGAPMATATEGVGVIEAIALGVAPWVAIVAVFLNVSSPLLCRAMTPPAVPVRRITSTSILNASDL